MDPEQLERLLHQHGPPLRLLAAQWCSTPDDCVQEAFIQLVRTQPVPRRVVPWLYQVVRNRAISASRAQQRRRHYESAFAGQTPHWFEPTPGTRHDGEVVTAALQTLPEDQREVIVARIWGELSFEEIAEVIGAATSTAHRRYEAANLVPVGRAARPVR